MMKNRFIPGIFCMVSLVGCATFGQLEEGLQGLIGQNLDSAVSKIGYPTSEREIAGMRLLEWRRSNSSVLAMPTTSTTTGYAQSGARATNFAATTTGSTLVPMNFSCLITLRVDSTNIIRGAQYDGNLGGCEPYILALRPKK